MNDEREFKFAFAIHRSSCVIVLRRGFCDKKHKGPDAVLRKHQPVAMQAMA
jgi:hypothetical protein